MKQESRFVAELYRFIVPFIEAASPVFVSLDGIAARKGVSDGIFLDSDVPDFWFTLSGSARPTLLEAKILGVKRRMTINQRQLTAWRSTGMGKHKPSAWVAADEGLTNFFYWKHSDFLPILNGSTATGPYPTFRMPNAKAEFPEIRQLALHVLRNV